MVASVNANLTVNFRSSSVDVPLKDFVQLSASGAAFRLRDRAKRNIRSAGRINTGAMLQSVRVQQLQSGLEQRWKVYTDVHYAIYQHEGVKPFGPRRARVLRWPAKSGGGYVFSTKSSGFPGVPFLRDAAESMKTADFRPRK